MIIEFNSTREPRALGLCGKYRVVQEIKAFRCFAREAHFLNDINYLLQDLVLKELLQIFAKFKTLLKLNYY